MKTISYKKKNQGFAISAGEAIAFSPWLFLIFVFVSYFSTTLNGKDQATIGSFIEWFGTAYSLFLALVLVNVWAQFETLDREFDFEVDALATLYHTIKSTKLPPSRSKSKKTSFNRFQKSIIEDIKHYIKHVRKNYFQEHSNHQQRRNGDIFLENINMSISSLAFSEILPDPIIAQFYESLNQAMDVRGDRLAHSKQHTRGVVLLVAYVASAVWLLSFFGVSITNPWVALVLIGGATFIIVMVVTIIRDLDKPFDGAWQVDLSDWDELLELIDPSIHVIFFYNLEDTIHDDIGNLIGTKHCKLRTLARTGFWGTGWRKFLSRLKRESDDASKTVDYTVAFVDKFIPYINYLEKPSTPIIILQRGDEIETLLDSTEISDCSDLNKLEAVLTQKIRNQFKWY